MKALVTGGTGFIGGHVVKRLRDARHGVRVFLRRGELPEDLRGEGVDAAYGDLEDPASLVRAMEGIDVFYHVGEIRNVNRAASDKNVLLMREIVSRLGETGVRRLVFVSSITVSGIPSSFPADEETNPQRLLRDHYSTYKKTCEEILAGAAGVDYAIIRPSTAYGPGSRHLGRLITAIEKFGSVGVPFIGTARNNAPLIFVKDLAEAIFLSGIEPSAAGQVFILTDGIRHSWLDFLSAIADRMGRKLRIVPVPPLLLKMSALPLEMLSGFFGVELDAVNYLDYFSRDLFFDNAKAKTLLQWQPAYSLTQGVSEMVDFYRPASHP